MMRPLADLGPPGTRALLRSLGLDTEPGATGKVSSVSSEGHTVSLAPPGSAQEVKPLFENKFHQMEVIPSAEKFTPSRGIPKLLGYKKRDP